MKQFFMIFPCFLIALFLVIGFGQADKVFSANAIPFSMRDAWIGGTIFWYLYSRL